VRITDDVGEAVSCLVRHGLVGVPTETVYGLAADAEDRTAVARVYAVKGRPADHPLIVHVADGQAMPSLTGPSAWARHVPQYALALAEQLWPGPLTLVLHRSARAGDHVTGGGDTVGLRCPAHPVAAALLTALATATGRTAPGLAAPSANRFGRLSPTRAEDVLADLGPYLDGERDCVLDGGPSRVGVESTILDCTGPAPALLRPGSISAAEVERATGLALARTPRPGVRAPGTLAAHYAPRARVVLVSPDASPDELPPAPGPADRLRGWLAPARVPTPPGLVRLAEPADAREYAQVLYRALREADALGLPEVLAVPPRPEDDVPGGASALAVTDRLRRAAASS